MAEQPNYYAILDVHPLATDDELRQAYRKKALAAHPDRGGSPRHMQRLNEAWEVLGNPAQRREYDAQRAAATVPAVNPTMRAKPAGGAGAKGVRPGPRSGPRPPTLARIAGAMLGKAFRAIVGEPEAGGKRKPEGARGPVIVACRYCGQKLRVRQAGGVRIRCPKCRRWEAL